MPLSIKNTLGCWTELVVCQRGNASLKYQPRPVSVLTVFTKGGVVYKLLYIEFHFFSLIF